MMEHKLSCSNLLLSLSDYIDGELSEALCEEIERHLAGCENCQVVLNTTRKTIELYHSTASENSMPGDVKLRLYKCLDIEDLLQASGNPEKETSQDGKIIE